jgi:hypothetical protein
VFPQEVPPRVSTNGVPARGVFKVGSPKGATKTGVPMVVPIKVARKGGFRSVAPNLDLTRVDLKVGQLSGSHKGVKVCGLPGVSHRWVHQGGPQVWSPKAG